ncbi:hypothetical protein Tco_0027483 [Tanacetum coccineum]
MDKVKRTIKHYEDMLRSLCYRFRERDGKTFTIVEFTTITLIHARYQGSTIRSTLNGRKCRSPVCWAEVGDSQLTGPEIIQETTEKIVQIRQRLQAARDRQRSYANVRRKPLEFQVGDRVLCLKVTTRKGIFDSENEES